MSSEAICGTEASLRRRIVGTSHFSWAKAEAAESRGRRKKPKNARISKRLVQKRREEKRKNPGAKPAPGVPGNVHKMARRRRVPHLWRSGRGCVVFPALTGWAKL